MKSLITSLIYLFLSVYLVSGQTDQEAIKILDKFSANALKAPSVTMKFSLISINLADNTRDTLQGSVIISKDKYKLDLPDNTIWFNGETSWSYLPAEKEVTITKADRKDNSFQSKPSQIFSMYKKGYKTRLIEEKNDLWITDLYPEDIKGDLLRIRLTIGKTFLNLISLEYKKKDGSAITLRVKEYDLKSIPSSDTFVFHKENFSGVEVVDMR